MTAPSEDVNHMMESSAQRRRTYCQYPYSRVHETGQVSIDAAMAVQLNSLD